jgi:hypothetical protein
VATKKLAKRDLVSRGPRKIFSAGEAVERLSPPATFAPEISGLL